MTIKAKKLIPENKQEKKQVTRVALVVDRSGSMSNVAHAALSGLNEQINALRSNAHKTETYVSLIQFDNEIEPIFDAIPAAELKDVTNYIPRGSTSLYDAIGIAIAGLKAAPVKENDDVGYLVIVISDGEENTSKEFTQAIISKEIKTLEETGDWTFTFMLANQDIHKTARTLNASMGNVHVYSSTIGGTHDAFAQMATSTAYYMSERAGGTKSMNNFYNTPSSPTTDEELLAKMKIDHLGVKQTVPPTTIINNPDVTLTTTTGENK